MSAMTSMHSQMFTVLRQYASLINGAKLSFAKNGSGRLNCLCTCTSMGRRPKSRQKKVKCESIVNGIDIFPEGIATEEALRDCYGLTDTHQNHKSAATFFENKYGFPDSSFKCTRNGTLIFDNPGLLRLKLPCQRYEFKRHFYTRRPKEGIGELEIVEKLEKALDKVGNTFPKAGAIQSQQHHVSQDTTQISYTQKDQENIEALQKLETDLKEIHTKQEKRSKQKQWRALRYSIGSFCLTGLILYWIYQENYGAYSRSYAAVEPETVEEKFCDVKGIDEAKEELMDVVKFLQEPDLFSKIGAKVPKGILLEGPPGVGKTLLARATAGKTLARLIAGEAGVPFFYANGSEFDEVFVGVGAKRLKNLFDTAKKSAPCILFIDEIDSVAPKRRQAPGQHSAAHQSINQLLTELDGFDKDTGVFVIAATNRKDVLDPAVLRPGRLDLHISVEYPDQKGREELFNHYLSKVKYEKSVDAGKLSRGTFGMSGADISNVVNQAALKAAKDGAKAIDMSHLEFAKDKIMMGAEKNARTPDEETNWITACHEAGHTVVGILTKGAKPVYKVTIMKRGSAMGHTQFLPEKEMYNLTKTELLAELDVLMGGRIAEEIMFGTDKVTTVIWWRPVFIGGGENPVTMYPGRDHRPSASKLANSHITSGASSDFTKATNVAKSIVMMYGMSEKVGIRVYSENERFLMSPREQKLIDEEVNRLLQESYDRTKALLTRSKGQLIRLAENLMKYETLNSEEVKLILEGKKLQR